MRPLNILQASHKAVEIVQRNADMSKLYDQAVRKFGEGELHATVLGLMTDTLLVEEAQHDVLSNSESTLSFCCGMWIQFLLVEIAGVPRDQLKQLAGKVFRQSARARTLH